MTQDKKHDVFAMPLTVGSKLININTWGITYFVTSDKSITQWSNLKGKTIYAPLKSSPPDIVLRYFLNSNGVNPDNEELCKLY